MTEAQLNALKQRRRDRANRNYQKNKVKIAARKRELYEAKNRHKREERAEKKMGKIEVKFKSITSMLDTADALLCCPRLVEDMSLENHYEVMNEISKMIEMSPKPQTMANETCIGLTYESFRR